MSRRGGAAQAGPSSGPGAQPSGGADLSSSYTIVTPAPGTAAVSDQTFKDFYESLDEFLPTVPDGLTEHALLRCGFADPDQRLVRLVSLAAQQLVADVAVDAHAVASQRQPKDRKPDAKAAKLVLTTEDLTQALAAKGVHVAKPPYFGGS